MKHSCTHWRPCLGPASVPLHSSALLTWGGQHGHHHYGEDELRVGPRLRSHLRAGRELPSDRHLLGQPPATHPGWPAASPPSTARTVPPRPRSPAPTPASRQPAGRARPLCSHSTRPSRAGLRRVRDGLPRHLLAGLRRGDRSGDPLTGGRAAPLPPGPAALRHPFLPSPMLAGTGCSSATPGRTGRAPRWPAASYKLSPTVVPSYGNTNTVISLINFY